MVLGAALAGAAVHGQTKAPVSTYERVSVALQSGNFAEAEKILRQTLRDHPSEPRALNLMGVVLDAQKRYDEADAYYQRALQINPRSAATLNNLGNHYMHRGDFAKARGAFLRVVAIESRHPNANLQLAQLSMAAKQGAAALKYLDRLPAEEQSYAAARILRAQALRYADREAEGAEVLATLEKEAVGDPRLSFSLGMIYAEWKRFEDAEKAFTQALDAAPTNFDILYNLGLAAFRASHFDRAREVFEVALKQRPQDVDLLENLARVCAETAQQDLAIVLLVKAADLAPDRPDIQLFLAHLAEEQGYFGDAATAYDRYYKLRPNDDVFRRERGFALARSARIKEGLVDLRWFVGKHPEDARGWYVLGVAETIEDRDRALECFNKAIALDPKLFAARYARGVALLKSDKAAEASEDLKIVLGNDPKDFHALDALGEAQLKLNRVEEALESFRQAVELSPKERRFLMHYATALQRAGRRQEAQIIFNRFKQLGPDEYTRRAKGGLFEYLKLKPEEQRALYLTHLRASLTSKPDDLTLLVRLGKAMLMEGDTAEAAEAFQKVLRLTSNPEVSADCAGSLLSAEQYALAKEFLSRLVAARPESVDARLDLVIAVFHAEGGEAGLAEVDKIPPDKRDGNFFLLRAQILDALGRQEEAARYLDRGLRAEPTRADMYFQAALFLMKHKDYDNASKLLAQAVRALPEAPELQLTQAIVYAILRQHDTAQELLTKIEARWPEWNLPYMIHGVILTIRRQPAQAEPLLETAISLGVESPVASYYLALALTIENPPNAQKAHEAIVKALELNPQDAFIQALAGRIAYLLNDYRTAEEHLQAALRLWPDMVEAHQTLSGVYRALGEREKSAAELKEIVRIKQADPTADQTPPFPVNDLLFTVRPPARPSS